MRYIVTALSVLLLLASVAYGGYRDKFEKEFILQPWAGGLQAAESACIECHTSDEMKDEYRSIPEQWKQSWHYRNDVSCHNCHGGDEDDASLAMSHKRGFLGSPSNIEVPDFCGKCHLGIIKVYRESGHGKVLAATGEGPSCVTCHGSHNIQKASIDIINEQRCTKCHSYERAKLMKQALFLVEKKLVSVENDFRKLRAAGVLTEDAEKSFFNTQAEFRTLFHAIDVDLVKARTDEFTKRLEKAEAKIADVFRELAFRRNLTTVMMLLFSGLAGMIFLISKDKKGE